MSIPSHETNTSAPFHFQDVHVWMRHGEGEHQELLGRAEDLDENDPEYQEIRRTLAETRDMDWNLTGRGCLQAVCAGQWIAKYLLSPGLNGEAPIVPNGMFDGGYTSPMNRAEQTVGIQLLAAAACLGRTAIRLDEKGNPLMPIDMRLREINLGEATWVTKKEYRSLHPHNVARRRIDPLFTAYRDGANIPEHMDVVIRSLYTTLGRDAAKGSRSALLSTHGRTVRAAALTIRRDHPGDFARIDRDEEIKNATMFITRRTSGSPRFDQFALITPWREEDGVIILNDEPPRFTDFSAPSSRSYRDLLQGLPHYINVPHDGRH